MKGLYTIAATCSLIAFVFFIVSLGTSEWTVFNQADSATYGHKIRVYTKFYAFSPYRYCEASSPLCSDNFAFTGKNSDSIQGDRLQTVRAFMVMTLVSNGGALIAFIFVFVAQRGALLTAIFSLVASLLGMMSMAIWTDVHRHLETNIMPIMLTGDIRAQRGYSLGMQITAWALCFLSAAVSAVAIKYPEWSKSDSTSPQTSASGEPVHKELDTINPNQAVRIHLPDKTVHFQQ